MELYIFAVFLFLWFLHLLRRSSFWLCLWQLKEYRLDRFWDGARENTRILVSPASIAAFFILLLSALLVEIPVWQFSLFEAITFALYLFFGIYSLRLFIRKRWFFPEFTQKTVILFLFPLLLLGLVIFYSFGSNFLISIFSLKSTALMVLVLELFFPLLISFWIGIIQIPTFLAKRWIINKAKKKRSQLKDLTVIGITGSYGKTSTKEFLYKLLSSKYKVLRTEGNTNSEIGVAKTVLNDLNESHQIFIAEMGAYKKGEIKTICNIVKPEIGILTGISHQHISLFGSSKNIIEAKYELIANLQKGGTGIFNGEDKESLKLSQRCSFKKRIYADKEGDAFSENIEETKDYLKFDFHSWRGKRRIKLNLLGKQNIENFLGAATCALEAGLSLKEIRLLSLRIKPLEENMIKKRGRNGVTVIDDSYSQNPDGVMSAVNYLKNYAKKKILVMPCLIELGKSAPSIHKNIGERIGEVCDLAIITSSYHFEELRIGVKSSGMEENQILLLKNKEEVEKEITSYLKKGNVVLIEGRVDQGIKKFLIPEA